MTDDIFTLCSLFYSSFYIPIIYVDHQSNILFEFPQIDNPENRQFSPTIIENLSSSLNPSLFSPNPSKLYGRVVIEKTQGKVIIGPVLNNAFSTNIFSRDTDSFSQLASDYRKLKNENLPSFNLNSFQNFLMLFHFIANHEFKSIDDHFSYFQREAMNFVTSQQVKSSYTKKEQQAFHNTYFLEQEMLSYIKHGETKKLIFFLNHKIGQTQLRAGKMSDSPLRQAKNLFLATATKVGNQAAIPGGMEIEEVYELIDKYTLSCEDMSSIDDILKLQYNMLVSFSDSVYSSKFRHLSAEMREIINFINNRNNQQTSLDDIAKFSHKSKSSVTKRFKEEMHTTVNQYILESKINEAKNLLIFSSMSLAEIAHYLNFSSQSYFSNCFKKVTGQPPYYFKKNYHFDT